jgi:purine-binding chemotaxis protein CheW
MRSRFNLEELEYGPTTVVIVLKVNGDDKSRIMGIVVDGVSDVYNMPDEEIKPSPDFGSAVDTDFVKGLATVHEKMVIVLDIDHMCNSRELSDIDTATS